MFGDLEDLDKMFGEFKYEESVNVWRFRRLR